MPLKVLIPTPLRKLTQDQGVVEAEGATIRDLIENLEKAYPGIRDRLYAEGGKDLNRFVNIYVNEEDIRFLENADTALKTGDEVSIVPSIAGGIARSLIADSATPSFITNGHPNRGQF